MNRKIYSAAIAVATGLALTLTACGGGDDSADGKKTLTLSLWNYSTTPEFKALIDGFEAEHPDVEVKPIDIPAGEDYAKKVTTMLAGGDTTDVITMKNVIDYARYGTRGQLMSLTDEAAKLDKNSYLGLGDFDLKGQYYALPYRSDFWVLYYNKKLLKSSGADLNNLTWQDYAKIAKASTSGSGDSKVYGTYQHTWRSVVQAVAAAQTGGDLLSGNYAFAANQYRLALDLEKSGATMPWATASTQKITYNNMFSTGKTAMLPMGSWYAALLLQAKAAGQTSVDWGIAPMPQIAKDGKITTFGSPTAFAVNKKAKHADLAKQFVLWATGEKGANALAKIGITPAYRSAAITSAFFGVPGMPNDALAKKAFQPDKVALEMPVSEKSSDIDAILTEEHQLVMTGGKSVDSGIAEMDKRVKSEVE